MKKNIRLSIAVIVIAAVTLVGMTACGRNGGGGIESSKCEIGFIIDNTVMEENSVNDAIWNGLIEYGEEKGVAHNYFIPSELSTNGIMQSVKTAVDGGAKIIVMKNGLSEEAFEKAQKKYPKVKFIMLAGDYVQLKKKPEKNGIVVNFNEMQAGYLAGYAVVTDKHRNLGIIMDEGNASQKRYAAGFIQGADAAAVGQGFSDIQVNCSVISKKSTDKPAAAAKLVKKQTAAGTDTFFVTGSADVISSVGDAAENKSSVVGSNIDCSKISGKVIASAVKCFNNGIKFGADLYYDKKFPGGKVFCLGLENDAVGIAPEKIKFEEFDEEDYEKLCDRVDKGSAKITASGKNNPAKTSTKIVLVQEI